MLVAGSLYFGQRTTQFTEPAYIAKVAKQIAVFQDPLPTGFQYQLAMNFWGLNILQIGHTPDDVVITFCTVPPMKQSFESAAKFTEELATKSNMELGTSSFVVKSTGEELVAGEKMAYVLGEATARDGRIFPAMVGSIITPNKKIICVYAIGKGKTYNLDETKQLLAAIKKI